MLRLQIVEKRNAKGDTEMQELAKRMLEKECLIYTFNGTQLTCTVKEITDGAILLDNGKETEVVNLDFIVRIREYPRTKNGKKKSVIVD